MKITRYKCRLVRPPGRPLAPVPKGLPDPGHPFVTLELGTDEGLEGIGFSSCGDVLGKALKSAVETLCELAIGEDPMRIEAVMGKLRAAASSAGPGGISMTACAAIDIALWDLRGKALGQTVCALAGGHRERVPVYASGALMRGFPIDHMAKTAALLKAQGWKQMKTQMGSKIRPEEEIARMRAVREAIGPEVDLMCDVNQLWSVDHCIDVARRIEDVNLYWLEDPAAHDDYPGLARINRELPMPIAAGEYVYGAVPFRHLIEARSIDIVMIDILRSGGVSGWLKIAHMAETFNLPVVSHLAPELQVHLVAALPNGLTVEYMPWSVALFEEVPVMEKGEIAVPDKPGFGLSFDQQVLEKCEVK
jgi:L-alanine-DL-glutamate epimerase-like enolase superfamily enzyme